MDINDFKGDDLIFALDIGTRSVIGTVGVIKENKFYVIAEEYIEHDERAMIDGQIHDITLVASKVMHIKSKLEKSLGKELKEVFIAAAGRFLRTLEVSVDQELDSSEEITKDVIRGLELLGVSKAQEEIQREKQGKLYAVGYSIKNYYLNGYSISNLLGHKGEQIKAEVIATFLPKSVIESLYGVMNRVGLKIINMTLEPIASMEAVIPPNLRLLNLALVDIGAGTSDIAISSNETIAAYGMVPLAGDEVTEAIVQALLVDFNMAEKIKREISTKDKVEYLDIIGLENTVSKDEVLNIIKPVVEKISEEVSSRIISLNGGKSPSAVFLVGGGAHTPLMKELLAKKLNLQEQRVAIRGREAVTQCVVLDNNMGSVGVTVLGIALVGVKSAGRDYIDVVLNDKVISLFNSHSHKVMDVLIQAGISPKVLMARNGKSLRYTLNGVKRVAFGELGDKAKVYINGKEETLDSKVKNGDNIELIYAKEGKNASVKCINLIEEINTLSFKIDDENHNLEPIFIKNGETVSPTEYVKEEDEVQVIIPKTIGDIKKYLFDKEIKLYKENIELGNEYIIKEGDNLTTKVRNVEESVNTSGEVLKVNINGKEVVLSGRKSYVFVDVFNYIEFDLSHAKGTINLKLNGKAAAYTDILKNGDNIEVFWS